MPAWTEPASAKSVAPKTNFLALALLAKRIIFAPSYYSNPAVVIITYFGTPASLCRNVS
jgi:hypothetical protein